MLRRALKHYEPNLCGMKIPLCSPFCTRFQIRAIFPFKALAFLDLKFSLKPILPTVPYAIVPTNAMVQIPVMTNPIGKIRILYPGRTKGAPPGATTRVWIGGEAWVLVSGTPETKFASSERRVVCTFAPVEEVPTRVTTGMRTCCRAALMMLAV
jgi:hypothetical protein